MATFWKRIRNVITDELDRNAYQRDWKYAIKALGRETPEAVRDTIAAYRIDKPDPFDYASMIVRYALDSADPRPGDQDWRYAFVRLHQGATEEIVQGEIAAMRTDVTNSQAYAEAMVNKALSYFLWGMGKPYPSFEPKKQGLETPYC